VVRAIGPASEVIRAYLDALDEPAADGTERSTHITFQHVDVLDANGEKTETLVGSESFTVRAHGSAHHELREPVFVVTIRGDHGPLFAGNMHIDGNWPESIPLGPFTVECQFEAPFLAPGSYRVELKVKQNVRTNFFEPRVLARFQVSGTDGLSLGGGAVPHHWRESLDHHAPEVQNAVTAGDAFAQPRKAVRLFAGDE
jgi:hypothetical protein